jgi:DNA-binding HxlR family transcriptional regulator
VSGHSICLCALESVVIAFDRKWSLRIISALGNYGELSFNQILKIFLGLTSKVLSETLKDLEKRGLIERDEDGGRIYYRLTKEGLEFKKSLIPMLSWALRKYGPSIFKNSCCNINITAENLAL